MIKPNSCGECVLRAITWHGHSNSQNAILTLLDKETMIRLGKRFYQRLTYITLNVTVEP